MRKSNKQKELEKIDAQIEQIKKDTPSRFILKGTERTYYHRQGKLMKLEDKKKWMT